MTNFLNFDDEIVWPKLDQKESSNDDSSSDSDCLSEDDKFGTIEKKVRSDTPPRQPTRTLFVGNLAVEVTESMLHELFSQFGRVIECCKRWYHYAFVQYSSENEAQDALQSLDGHRIQGRAMRVEFQRKKVKAMMRGDECNSAHHANISTLKPIYISVHETDSYFTKPGEHVMPCVEYKCYELFPSLKNDGFLFQKDPILFRVKSEFQDEMVGSDVSRTPLISKQLSMINESFPALSITSTTDYRRKSLVPATANNSALRMIQ